ncbi:MAG: transposase [Gallintestinimicrobium sp.]
MVLIQHLYGVPSLRRTADEISANICCRWFFGYTLQEETPHFSTVSYNFRHRFTAETVDQVFAWILEEVAEAGYLSSKAVFLIGIIRYTIHDSIGKSTFTITDLLVPFTFTELRTKDR